MPKMLRIFATGLFISFLGTLPLGTMNIAAMQISVSDGLRPAMKFAIGVLLVEIVYVRISLVAMNWIRKNQRLFRILEWVTLLAPFNSIMEKSLPVLPGHLCTFLPYRGWRT